MPDQVEFPQFGNHKIDESMKKVSAVANEALKQMEVFITSKAKELDSIETSLVMSAIVTSILSSGYRAGMLAIAVEFADDWLESALMDAVLNIKEQTGKEINISLVRRKA